LYKIKFYIRQPNHLKIIWLQKANEFGGYWYLENWWFGREDAIQWIHGYIYIVYSNIFSC
jgi:hypothetical protein